MTILPGKRCWGKNKACNLTFTWGPQQSSVRLCVNAPENILIQSANAILIQQKVPTLCCEITAVSSWNKTEWCFSEGERDGEEKKEEGWKCWVNGKHRPWEWQAAVWQKERQREKERKWGGGRTWLPLVTSLCFLRKLKLYLKQPLMLNSYSAPPTSSVPNTTAAA